jgi:glycine cleavage system transcriptional repressor
MNVKNYLVISAVGQDRPGLVDELSQTIYGCGCSIVDSRMAVLGGEFAMILMLGGNWNEIAKL